MLLDHDILAMPVRGAANIAEKSNKVELQEPVIIRYNHKIETRMLQSQRLPVILHVLIRDWSIVIKAQIHSMAFEIASSVNWRLI